MTNKYSGEYSKLYDTAYIKSDKKAEVQAVANKIRKGKDRYIALQQKTKVPWYVIGLIHNMEADCDFTKHLHNGDPLNARTWQVPAGRPLTGRPPFTFEFSAIDALKMMKLDQVDDWSVSNILYILEGFNGYGYRKKNVNSPYLWSYSNHYTKGKYVADGKFDPNAVSKQPGSAIVMKLIRELEGLENPAAPRAWSFLSYLFGR